MLSKINDTDVTATCREIKKEIKMKATNIQLQMQKQNGMLFELTKDTTCACCGRKLNEKSTVWLEQSFVTAKFYIDNVVPQKDSQGYFPFGMTCAKKIAEATY